MTTSPGAGGQIEDEWAARFDSLKNRLGEAFSRPPDQGLGDREFNDLALAVFDFQFRFCEPYGAYCFHRGRDPGSVEHWSEIPAVPTAAFKHVDLVSGRLSDVSLTFRTSGTTRGPGGRGAHHVLDPELYRASLLPSFQRHLLPDGRRGLPILCLLPEPAKAPDSSLSRMMATAVEEFGGAGSGWLVDPDTGLDLTAFVSACRDAAEGGPVLLAGTAFSFVHLIDGLDGAALRLPEGSRLMETGGFKGRARQLPRAELYEALGHILGIPESFMVNEYGMTELLSQYYDGVAGEAGALPRSHRGPAWVRSRVLDPVTLNPSEPGRAGLLCHYDLANVGSVSAVLTEDLGIVTNGGIRVLGRAAGAEPRGCSIALDDLLTSVGGT